LNISSARATPPERASKAMLMVKKSAAHHRVHKVVGKNGAKITPKLLPR
jgi:hypothetical protein